ncbi:hypothetical protein UB31_09685 [Bradyrhizobium sp. LTSP849]|uniref:hypothetical protein n=1 Tax=Bradyrhizobium sp. LTSP849 TaxID=1615890 RepID=UPI0005D2C3E5|nr:hypothetical protein [Bradyrhizobium sp. LTSP849]KJC52550.1 hypothetical protein UB31_09685 [Bradyrhizobium sp. LTSP849]
MTAPDFRKNSSGYDTNFGASRFYGFGAALTRVTGDVALDRSYRGGIILFDSSSGGTITLPANLPAGFNVSVIQINAGQATIAPGAGAVLQSQQGFTKTAGQWAMLGVVAHDSGVFTLVGNGA